MKKIAILGTGNLGLSIAKGIIENQAYETLYLTNRELEDIKYLQENKNVTVTLDNSLAIQKSDIIIIAVQPFHLPELWDEIKSEITKDHLLISTVAGLKTSQIEEVFGVHLPIVRVMPNTAISKGRSMTCLCSNDIGKSKMKDALEIFNKLGVSLEIPEEKMQAATVICSSGIAFWLRLIRASMQGAIQLGFESDEALKMSVQTCLGAVSLLDSTGGHPEQEIDRVTTPGGCTIEGLNEMEFRGISSAFIKGIRASYEKINPTKNRLFSYLLFL